MIIPRPQSADYAPAFENYIQLLPETIDVLEVLQKQQQEIVQLLGRVTASEADYAYAPGKWSIKQLLGHMNDTERIMAYRTLCVARGEKMPLPGFDEKDYVLHANFEERTLAGLLEEHGAIRTATIALLSSLPESAFSHTGNANGYPITVAALAHIIVGHERHHLQILKERYLVKL